MTNKFHGHPTRRLSTDFLTLDYLIDAGPRLVRLSLKGSDVNLLGEAPTVGWETPSGYYHLLGGHRLWASPEEPGITYAPDDSGLTVREIPSGVELAWEPKTGEGGIAKFIRIEPENDRAAIQFVHRITNRFAYPVTYAPWAITVLPLGGTAYLPCPPIGEDFQPDRALVLWPYTRWNDPRLGLHEAGLTVRAEAAMPPIKVGAFSASGWTAYERDGVLLFKCFEPLVGEYSDMGCNVEIYCSDKVLELETLAPAMHLKPGQSTEFSEIWEIHTGEAVREVLEDFE
jgi:hypothetical protein